MLTALYLVAIILLVLANGFFVAAEFALVGLRRSRIETLAQTGDRRAVRLISILDNLNAYLSASQLGITLASLGLGWLGEPTVARLIEEPLESAGYSPTVVHIISFFIAFAIVTALHITVGEQAPKLFGLQRAERVALATALPMQLFYKVFSLPIRALDSASAAMVRPLGIHADAGHASAYTQEELRHVIEMSRQGGHIEAEEQRLIHGVFEFADAEVREAMVPRTNVKGVSASADFAEVKAAFREHGYSRLPVYRERLDDVDGVIFRRDIEDFLDGTRAGLRVRRRRARAPAALHARDRQARRGAQADARQPHAPRLRHRRARGTGRHRHARRPARRDRRRDRRRVRRGGEVADRRAARRHVSSGRHARRARRQPALPPRPPRGAGTTRRSPASSSPAPGVCCKAGDTVEHEGATFRVERVERRRLRWVRLTPAPEPAAATTTEAEARS